jgi:hypothetical protein
MTAVEWLIDEFNQIKSSSTNMNGNDNIQFLEKEFKELLEQAKAMEHKQMKRVALHFIVVGGQECGCNWNEMDFTDEFNKVIKRSI